MYYGEYTTRRWVPYTRVPGGPLQGGYWETKTYPGPSFRTYHEAEKWVSDTVLRVPDVSYIEITQDPDENGDTFVMSRYPQMTREG